MTLTTMLGSTLLQLLAQEQETAGGYRQTVDTLARTPLSQIFAVVAVLTVLRMALAPYLRTVPKHKRQFGYAGARFGNEVLDAVIYAGVFVFMIIRPFAIQAFLIPSGSMWPTLYVNDFIIANKAIYRYSNPKVNDIVVFRPPKQATFEHPEDLDAQGNVKVDFIKRCQGGPGDVVELRQGVLYRNGLKVPDPNAHYSTTIDQTAFAEKPHDQLGPLASFKFVKWNGRLIPLNYLPSNPPEANADVSGTLNSYSVAPDFVLKSPADQARAIRLPAQPLPPGCYLMMGDNRNNSSDGRCWGYVTRDAIIGRSEVIWLPINRIGITR